MKNDLLAKLEGLDEIVSNGRKDVLLRLFRHTEKSWKQRFMSFWKIRRSTIIVLRRKLFFFQIKSVMMKRLSGSTVISAV